MPRRICLKDSKSFYYAYKIGKNKQKIYYGEVMKGNGQFTSYNATRKANYYGEEFEFDGTLILEHSKFPYIDEFTQVWINEEPNSNEDLPTHKVTGCGDVKDGLQTIYLKSNLSNSDTLYFEYEDTILEIDVKFDFDKKIATILENMYCPIDYLTKVWYNKPIDNNSTDSLLKLIYKETSCGFTRLTFEEV